MVLPNTSVYKLALFQFFNALGSRADSVCFEHSNFVNVNVPAHQDTQSRRLQMIVLAHSVTTRGGRTLTSPSPAGAGFAHRQDVRMCVPVIKWPLINFRHYFQLPVLGIFVHMVTFPQFLSPELHPDSPFNNTSI